MCHTLYPLLLLLTFLFSVTAKAATDVYPFPNDELRVRYQALIVELRCPRCLNTNLAGSNAMIAKDLRSETHRLLLQGHTDQQILAFMQERYGDFILYEPELKSSTWVLWFGPGLLLLIALAIGVRLLGQRRRVAELSAPEQATLDVLLAARQLKP